MNNEPENALPFWRTLWGYIGPHKRSLMLSMMCSGLVGIAVALQPLCIKWIVDDGLLKSENGVLCSPEQRFESAMVFVGFYVFLSIARIIVWVMGFRQMVESIETVIFEIRSRFFKHVQDLCFRFHDNVSSGELYNYIMGSPITSIKTFLHQGAMSLPYQVISWVVAFGALATFNLPLTFITLGMVLSVVFLNHKGRFRVKAVSSRFMETESSASRYISDMLRGSRAVKLYAMEKDVSYSFESQIDRVRGEGVDLAKCQQIEYLKPEAVQYLGMAVLYAAGGWFCVQGELEVGEFLAFSTSVNILMAPLMALAQLNLIRGNAEAGLTRIVQILKIEKTTPELAPQSRECLWSTIEKDAVEGTPAVEWRDVSFSYREDVPLFERLNLRLERGESVALVGSSGSGKSSFVSLLLRMYEIQSGHIALLGHDIKHYGLSDLRSAFGVVPQDPFLFQGSILDNIKIVRPDASMDEVRDAARLALIEDFVNELPQGYDTLVGENGTQLSGGQRQRIAIARAALSKAEFYIFDEATSALDNDSERRIQSAMEALMSQKTTIVIAHRLSTIQNVDRILVFDKGTIVQDGSYEKLSTSDGAFKTLLQASEYA